MKLIESCARYHPTKKGNVAECKFKDTTFINCKDYKTKEQNAKP